YVALALYSKRDPKAGRGMTIRLGQVPPNADATYDPATNTFDFPSASYGTSPFQRGAILHECTHALRDALGARIRTSPNPKDPKLTTRALSEEAAAFLAGALFQIYDTTPPGGTPATPSWAQGTDVFAVAHTLAVKLVEQQGVLEDLSGGPLPI